MEDHTALAYLVLLHTHRTLVVVSVVLFVARAAGVAWLQPWPMQPLARWGSVVIDTVLMAAGIALWVLVRHNPLQEPWLAVKLLLLLLYIVLGSFGLKRGGTQAARIGFSALALLVVLQMVAIARWRDPMGLLALVLRT
jgi:uncharacterized membrane protein SirB2